MKVTFLWFLQDDKLVDPFVIYCPKYTMLRGVIADAIYLKKFSQLEEKTEVIMVYRVTLRSQNFIVIGMHSQQLPSEDVVPLLLALYEKVTLVRTTSTGLSKQVIDEVWLAMYIY